MEHAEPDPFRSFVGVWCDLGGGESLEEAEEGGADARRRVGDQREQFVEEGIGADWVVRRLSGDLGYEMCEGLTALLVRP